MDPIATVGFFVLVSRLGMKPLWFYCALLKSICGASRWRSLAPQMLFIMVDKEKYIKKFKEIFEAKNKTVISDAQALEYLEQLVCLVGAVTGDININKITLPKIDNNE